MLYGYIGTNITRQKCKLFYPLKNKFRRTSLGNTTIKDMRKAMVAEGAGINS